MKRCDGCALSKIIIECCVFSEWKGALCQEDVSTNPLRIISISFHNEVQPDGPSVEYVKYVEKENISRAYRDKNENKVIKNYVQPTLKEMCRY